MASSLARKALRTFLRGGNGLGCDSAADAPAAEAESHHQSSQLAPATMTRINPDLRLEKLTNGKTYLRKTSDGSVQEISIEVYEAMLGQHFSKRSAPSSGITSLASAKEEDSEIEWGDMDPEAARNLQSEMVKAYKTLKNHRKLARFDPTTQTFEATTTRLASLDAQSRISNLTLQSIESEQQRRTVLIHNVPPFSAKAVIDSNIQHLLEQSGLTWDDTQSISNHLLTSCHLFLEGSFAPGTYLQDVFFFNDLCANGIFIRLTPRG